jgi:hypothetical protein
MLLLIYAVEVLPYYHQVIILSNISRVTIMDGHTQTAQQKVMIIHTGPRGAMIKSAAYDWLM